MKTHLLVLHFLASALATTVRGKPHSNHQNLAALDEPQDSQKFLAVLREADPEQEEVLPTSITFEDDSQEQESADISYHKSEMQLKEARLLLEKSTPILLSEKVLAGDLLEVSEEEEEEDEDQNADQDKVAEEGTTKRRSEEEERDDESSTESEITTDMDYAGDSHDLDSQDNPLEHREEVKPLTDAGSEILPTEGSQSMEKIPVSSGYEPEEGEGAEKITGILEEQDDEPVAEREDLEEMTSASPEEGQNEGEGQSDDTQESKNNAEFEEGPSTRQAVVGREEKERNRNDSVTYSKGKVYKQKKDRRAEQPSEILDEEKQGLQQKGNREKETDLVENTAQEVNMRKTGKSATLAGLNPVQVRANEELYPFEQVSLDESTQEALVNPCANFRCKRGKTCKVSEKNEPSCFCQDPTSCAPSTTEIENVCGTDNKTYDTSCALFATKCKLEGTKRGHQLHLDYTGSCKYIAPCQEGELSQFPLRMRDWLKNVLLQLYERDMRAPGFLLPKQRVKVQKIYESERRLHGDDHPIELLIQDFQKNYHMYIYPVHWQFAQLDKHPADRFLSHTELAPLRVPLVPMEHCTSLFFKQCDADKDRLVSFKEWGNCFGIKDEDMDLNLLI